MNVRDLFDLTGRVAIVTGGSRGLGQEFAEGLAEAGASLMLCARREQWLAPALDEMRGRGFRAEGRVCDVSDAAEVRAVVEATVTAFGRIDILVNNAGTNPSGGQIMDVDMGAIDKTWLVNQRAPLVWSRLAYHAGMKQHGGTIVNVASVGGLRPSPIIGAYNVSKAALIHLTHQLAFELAPKVRVNAVAPAVVKTKLSELLWADEEAAARTHPLGRLGVPEDVAAAITFLASDQASWLTGVVLPVDGGVSGASGTLA
ncbi:MAG TPA: SDR family oxidoreductase [Acidimicrobiia bacterium]|nr:SDR family oxidoreductase [Acidimicrobiia bacterium]